MNPELQQRLLELHRILLETERVEYERARGRQPAGDFLKALIEDPSLAWLRPFTALLAQEEPVTPAQARSLLVPDAAGSPFQQRYAEALQRSPETLVAHGRAMSALRQPPPGTPSPSSRG